MNLYQVDSFAEKPYTGNPAGVCLLTSPRPDDWMLAVAGEMNLSETAFVLPEGDRFSLRWFTPKTEVSLCGHATLASAHILWEERLVAEEKVIEFSTKGGTIPVRTSEGMIEMDFPARRIVGTEHNEAIDRALGISPSFTGTYAGRNGEHYLLQLASEDVVKRVTPDFAALSAGPARSVIVTARSSDPRYDFVSRFFAPIIGIDEDPVTGSAHCSLAPYWGSILGRTEMVGYQASRRTGIVRCAWKGDRVWIGGKAVTVFKGELLG